MPDLWAKLAWRSSAMPRRDSLRAAKCSSSALPNNALTTAKDRQISGRPCFSFARKDGGKRGSAATVIRSNLALETVRLADQSRAWRVSRCWMAARSLDDCAEPTLLRRSRRAVAKNRCKNVLRDGVLHPVRSQVAARASSQSAGLRVLSSSSSWLKR